ncbi:MAG: hypothetical protein P8168_03470 [Deltaproteobacteria bacterium]
MSELLITSKTPYYEINSIKTSIKPKYKSKTPHVFQKINPIFSATHFYERYKLLNLLFYQQIMEKKDFEIFIDFVGGESIGVKKSDFEIYYPED